MPSVEPGTLHVYFNAAPPVAVVSVLLVRFPTAS